MEVNKEKVTALSLTIVTGGMANIFLLLSLLLTWKYWRQIPKYRLLPIPFLQDGSQQCVSFYFFNSAEEEYYYLVGCVTALVYFPLSVVIVCGVVSGFLLKGRQGNVRGEEHVSDLLITGILGTLLFICCVPYYTHLLGIRRAGHSSYEEELVSSKLAYLEHCRNIFSALFTAAFAYLYVYRKRSETHLAPTTCGTAIGERQQLVN